MSKKAIDVAVGVIAQQGRILISKRADHVDQGGLWEFPGGKIGLAEAPDEALHRELKEELGILIASPKAFMQIWYDYQQYSVLLHVFIVSCFTGTPIGVEGQCVQWVNEDNIQQREFPKANEAILSAIKAGLQQDLCYQPYC